MKKSIFLFFALFSITQVIQAQQDNYLWLEEVDGEKALKFVESQNEITLQALSKEKDYPKITF